MRFNTLSDGHRLIAVCPAFGHNFIINSHAPRRLASYAPMLARSVMEANKNILQQRIETAIQQSSLNEEQPPLARGH